MKFKLLLELKENHKFPDGKEKRFEFFRNFLLFAFLYVFFGGNNPHYLTILYQYML